MAKCSKTKWDSNACKNLHRTVRTFGRMLPVKITEINTFLRRSRRRKVETPVNYPVLRFSDWAELVLDNGGHFFLGGRSLDHWQEFGRELEEFWSRFQVQHPDFGFFQDYSRSEWATAVPICLHGDEGRGKSKNPVMVLAAQTVLPIREGRTNMAGSLGYKRQSSVKNSILNVCRPSYDQSPKR